MSLRSKLLVSSVSGVALLLGLVLWISGRWGEEQLEAAATARGEILARSLARSTAEQAVVGNYTQTRSIVERLVASGGADLIYAVVLDDEERVRACSRTAAGQPHFDLGESPRDGLTSAGVEPGSVVVRRTSFEGAEVLDLTALQQTYGRVWGAVRVGLRLGEVRIAVSQLHFRVTLLGMVALALGALGAGLLAGRIVGPLRALLGGVERVAGGDYAARVTLDRRDEIGRLALGFNRMSEAIERQLAEVREKNRQMRVGYDVLEQLSSTIEKETLLRRLLDASARSLEATRCTVLALEPERGVVESFELREGNYQSVVLDPASFGLTRFEDEQNLSELLRRRRGLSLKPENAAAALALGERDVGLLFLSRPAGAPFSDADRRLVEVIARHLAVALQNARRFERALAAVRGDVATGPGVGAPPGEPDA